jgi:hypothetical protein
MHVHPFPCCIVLHCIKHEHTVAGYLKSLNGIKLSGGTILVAAVVKKCHSNAEGQRGYYFTRSFDLGVGNGVLDLRIFKT